MMPISSIQSLLEVRLCREALSLKSAILFSTFQRKSGGALFTWRSPTLRSFLLDFGKNPGGALLARDNLKLGIFLSLKIISEPGSNKVISKSRPLDGTVDMLGLFFSFGAMSLLNRKRVGEKNGRFR